MALIVGQNSLVSVADADAYFTDRANAKKWFNLPEVPVNPGEYAKDTLLVTSFNALRMYTNGGLTATSTDENAKQAQLELTHYYNNHLSLIESRNGYLGLGLKRLKVSKREEEYEQTNGDLYVPPYIGSLLHDYITGGSRLVDLNTGCENNV